jgi:hypothetical protein
MSLLCTLERAKLSIPTVTTADDRIISALIASCSSAIEKYLRRRITIAEHDELLDGVTDERLLLRHYPVQRVDSVRHGPKVVLEITNTASTNQQARVEVQRDGLRLARVASGTMTVDSSVIWASNATLQAVATAVSALSGGWSARVIGSSTGDYGLWPSRDLWIAPAFGESDGGMSFDCRGRWAGLSLHVGELAGYAFDARGWLYWRDPWADVWPLAGAAGWEGGPGYWRIRYTAGYPEIPAAIEEACAEWVAELFALTRRDPALAMQSAVGAASSSFVHESMPTRVKGLLAPWRALG